MNKLDGKSKRVIHLGFEIGLLIKGLNGIIEIIAGLMFLYFPEMLMRFINFIVKGELSEDPQDIIVSLLLNWANYSVVGFRILIGAYLLLVGIVKIGFVVALFKKKLWSYVIYEWILGAFVVYQSYRYVLRHELFVLILTLLDIFVMAVVYLEYLRVKKII